MTTKYYLLILFILNYFYFIHSFGHPKLSRILLQEVKTHPLPKTTGLKDKQVNAKTLINIFEKIPTRSFSNQLNLTSPHAPGDSDRNSEDDKPKEIYLQESNLSKEENISSSGVPLDYSFNETVSRPDYPNTLISSPGCPPSEAISFLPTHPWHRHIWVYYGSPPSCYKIGRQGPCPNGMSLGALSRSTYGRCSCNCFSALGAFKGKSTENLVVNQFMDQQRKFCGDKYSSFYAVHTDNKCYKLYTRGPCGENETFVVDPSTNQAKCKVIVKCSFTPNPETLPRTKNRKCGDDDKECYLPQRKNQAPECRPCSSCPYLPKSGIPFSQETDDNYDYYEYITAYSGSMKPMSISPGIPIRKPICDKGFQYSTMLRACVEKSLASDQIG